MNVQLSPDLERFVDQKIRDGQYQSVDDLVCSALQVLRQQESLSREDVAELRREIALGLEQLERGESVPWDAAVLKDRIRDLPGRG